MGEVRPTGDSSPLGPPYPLRHARLWLPLVFAMVWPTVLAWLYFVALAGLADHERRTNPTVQVVYGSGKAVQFVLPVLCVWAWERRWPRPVAPSWRGVEFGIGFGLLVSAGILALYYGFLRGCPLFRGSADQMQAKLEGFGLASPGGYVLLAAFLAVVHSLLEEYYWRWFVFGWLRRVLPLVVALVLSSLAFMAHHVLILAVFFPGQFWTATVPFALCIAGGGLVWAWLYQRTGSIYAPWLSHLLIDAAIMAVGFDLLFVVPR